MKYPYNPEQVNLYARPFSFGNLRAQFSEDGLYVRPFDIARHWAVENQFKSFEVSPFHTLYSTAN
ncbi:MAG: hypothetical protein A2521_13565 [Deltaproteobacteria bacterium RIFOXYD12_FULL_57_12]|nr:MAG: hypothetical protein A2521_13565 [Deltaproteobacteria bacterium RIFOXYD12_FULL_57_12]